MSSQHAGWGPTQKQTAAETINSAWGIRSMTTMRKSAQISYARPNVGQALSFPAELSRNSLREAIRPRSVLVSVCKRAPVCGPQRLSPVAARLAPSSRASVRLPAFCSPAPAAAFHAASAPLTVATPLALYPFPAAPRRVRSRCHLGLRQARCVPHVLVPLCGPQPA